MRPKDAQSGAGGAGAAGAEAAPPQVLREGRSTAASEQTRMTYRRTATDPYAEKSGRGAGSGAGAAGGRVVAAALRYFVGVYNRENYVFIITFFFHTTRGELRLLKFHIHGIPRVFPAFSRALSARGIYGGGKWRGF